MTKATQKTELEIIEDQRIRHIGAAIARTLLGTGITLEPEALVAAAQAAAVAVDRFPEDAGKYPFDCDLRQPPARLHPQLRRSIDDIDAAVFSGDSFAPTDNHLFLAGHLQRWSKKMRLMREDDYHNRPEDPDDDPEDIVSGRMET